MEDTKQVKDILIPIEQYETVSEEALLCDVLAILKKKCESIKTHGERQFHTPIFAVDSSVRS